MNKIVWDLFADPAGIYCFSNAEFVCSEKEIFRGWPMERKRPAILETVRWRRREKNIWQNRIAGEEIIHVYKTQFPGNNLQMQGRVREKSRMVLEKTRVLWDNNTNKRYAPHTETGITQIRISGCLSGGKWQGLSGKS